MRFLIDECLHASLVELAQTAGFDATHVSHLGLGGTPDWALAQRIVRDESRLSPTTVRISSICIARWTCTPA